MAVLILPTGERPLAMACWLIRAVKPAHKGAEQLVPPKDPELPLL